MATLTAESWEADRAAILRDFIGQVAMYGYLPLPAPEHWALFELEAQHRLSRIWQLCRSITRNDQMPMNLDACLSIIRALNEEPVPYPADPGGQPKQAPAAGSHPYVLQPVAQLGADGRDSGQTTWQRVTRR